MPGTVLERLCKRAQLAYKTLDGAYKLTPDVFAPTAAELRAVAAEVSDEALTKAITALKETVVSSRSGRRGAPTRKVGIIKLRGLYLANVGLYIVEAGLHLTTPLMKM